MSLTGGDVFEAWRALLALVCTVYAAVVTGRSCWGWIVYFSGGDRVTSLLRRYTIVQLLRLRVRRFTGELARIGFWLSALVAVLYGHYRLVPR
jgi:hypothetical protein